MDLSIKQRIFVRRIILIVVICLIVIVLLPVKIPSNIKTQGYIIPKSNYQIIKLLPDGFIAEMQHYIGESKDAIQSFNFERGDVVKIDINQASLSNEMVRQGDTLAVINSSQLEYALTELKGQLEQKRSLLKSYKTGDKASVIQQAQHQLKLKQHQVATQKKITTRIKELYKANLESKQNYEQAHNLLNIYKSEVEIAKAQLKTVKTGEKLELIELVEQEIKNLQKQIKQLQNKKESHALISPISGQAYTNFSSDTICAVEDQSVLGVVFPIQAAQLEEVEIGQTVKVSSPIMQKNISAEIITINKKVTNMGTAQIFTAIAQLKNTEIPTGTRVKCKILCGKESIYRKIIKIFRTVEIN